MEGNGMYIFLNRIKDWMGLDCCLGCLVVLVLSSGCASSALLNYYEAIPDVEEETIPDEAEQQIVWSKDLVLDQAKWREDGYMAVGRLKYVGAPCSSASFRLVARTCKAPYILLKKTPQGRTSGSIATTMTTTVLTPSPTGGLVATPQTSTMLVPYEESIYIYDALFLRREKYKSRLGIDVEPLSRDDVLRAETRKAVVVKNVLKTGLAWRNDVFEGDVILSIDGQPIESPTAFRHWEHALTAGPHAFKILRLQKTMEKVIVFPDSSTKQ